MENNETLKMTQDYIISFLKAPITTLKNSELDLSGAIILLGLLPFALFLATWSLMNRLITTLITTVSGAMGGLGSLLLPDAGNLHADAMSTISWGGMFFNVLLLAVTWFALMLFVPILITKILKITTTICLKTLFIQTTVLTIPMTTMFLVATILGFMHLALWFLPVVVAIIAPILLHFTIIRKTWQLDANKTLYIVVITQIVIVIVVGLLFAGLAAGMGNSLMDGLFF